MVIPIQKDGDTNTWRMEDRNFATPVHKVKLAIKQTLAASLWHKGIQNYRFWKMDKMVATKQGLSSQNAAKLANLIIGHPPVIFSDII